MGYNLLDNFREQGWDFLIPVHLEKTVTGEYVDYENIYSEDTPSYKRMNSVHTRIRDYGDYEPEIWDEDSDYYDDYDIEADENGEHDDRQSNVICFDRPDTLYDLKYELDCDALSDDEFLSMSAGDILGITNSQLKFVSQKAIQSAGIARYRDILNERKNDISSIEQRIKYVNVISQVSFTQPRLNEHDNTVENRAKYDKFLKNIINKHIESEAVQLIKWHMDYLRMRPLASIINHERRDAGEASFDYVMFPKTSHIKDLHDKAVRDFSTLKSREAKEHKEESNRLINVFINSSKYRYNLFKGDIYSVISVESVDDILHEADTLQHCVASYIDAFAKGDSYLYFIRRNTALSASLYTVELKEMKGAKFKMTQCYGYKDTIDKDEDLRQFIYQWCKAKSIMIDCPI